MKTVEQLAQEVWPGKVIETEQLRQELQRFHDLAIAQYRESLLAGVGEPATVTVLRSIPYYTANQMAAAVLRATSAERALHKPNCKECAKWGKEQADNKEWIDGVAEGRRIVEKLAAAIRGQR